MAFNRDYRKLYRKYLMHNAIRRKDKSLWLDKKSERHIQLIAFLFISGFFLILIFGTPTLLTWIKISQIYAALAVVFSFIPTKILPFIYRLRKELKVLLAIFGLAPFITGLVLTVNFTFTTKQFEQKVKITKYNYYYADRTLQITTDSPELNKHREVCQFTYPNESVEPDSAVFVIRKGIFGISSVRDKWLVLK